ncbi:hypothetical protein MNBD_GAMMA05-1635 [hydrothermal vent metagenome]|uniref:DUF4124 domain-containing protein n=1 Tax=hydrothermal vent metagenome TaxID=652676 RepID=A0A3B0WDR5_9ZZZZ
MIIKIIISSITTVSLSLLLHTSAIAGVYKWVDENGQVHYGAHPGNTGAERVTIRKNDTTKPRAIKTDKDGKQAEGDGQDTDPATAEAKKPEEPKIPKKEKRRMCKEAKSDIASINSRGRMREINKKGEYTYLSEKQRQKRLSTARKKQRKYCR